MTNKVVIVLPSTASSKIDLDLIKLTKILSKKFNLPTSYGLGGEYGYGVDFENDVFLMKRYCWCEKDDCLWCAVNDEKLEKKLFKRFGDKVWANWGYAPNFWHKPSGFMIRWYKWIGRDMEFNKKITLKKWEKIYSEVLKSIKKI